MCVCVCVCVGECLPACPCMCDEGSELVFPSITCPGPPNLYRVGVQQSLCSGGTQGRDSLGGLAPRWGWRGSCPHHPWLGWCPLPWSRSPERLSIHRLAGHSQSLHVPSPV